MNARWTFPLLLAGLAACLFAAALYGLNHSPTLTRPATTTTLVP